MFETELCTVCMPESCFRVWKCLILCKICVTWDPYRTRSYPCLKPCRLVSAIIFLQSSVDPSPVPCLLYPLHAVSQKATSPPLSAKPSSLSGLPSFSTTYRLPQSQFSASRSCDSSSFLSYRLPKQQFLRGLSAKVISTLTRHHEECERQAYQFYSTAQDLAASPPEPFPPAGSTPTEGAAAAAEGSQEAAGGSSGGDAADGGGGDVEDGDDEVSPLVFCVSRVFSCRFLLVCGSADGCCTFHLCCDGCCCAQGCIYAQIARTAV